MKHVGNIHDTSALYRLRVYTKRTDDDGSHALDHVKVGFAPDAWIAIVQFVRLALGVFDGVQDCHEATHRKIEE